jgi:hypothetical protein
MVADGIRESKVTAGQRLTAAEESSCPEAKMLTEQVVGHKHGLVNLLHPHQRFADSMRTAVCRTARTVV